MSTSNKSTRNDVSAHILIIRRRKFATTKNPILIIRIIIINTKNRSDNLSILLLLTHNAALLAAACLPACSPLGRPSRAVLRCLFEAAAALRASVVAAALLIIPFGEPLFVPPLSSQTSDNNTCSSSQCPSSHTQKYTIALTLHTFTTFTQSHRVGPASHYCSTPPSRCCVGGAVIITAQATTTMTTMTVTRTVCDTSGPGPAPDRCDRAIS